MFIIEVKQILDAYESFRNGKSDTVNHILVNMANNAKFLKENVDAQPSNKQYQEVSSFISEISGIELGIDDIKTLLSLYPKAKIKVALYNVDDTDVRDDICFALSHFILGCAWPTFGDDVDMKSFIGLLQRQATQVGFTVKKNSK